MQMSGKLGFQELIKCSQLQEMLINSKDMPMVTAVKQVPGIWTLVVNPACSYSGIGFLRWLGILKTVWNLIYAIPNLEKIRNLLSLCKVFGNPHKNVTAGKMTNKIIRTFWKKEGNVGNFVSEPCNFGWEMVGDEDVKS